MYETLKKITKLNSIDKLHLFPLHIISGSHGISYFDSKLKGTTTEHSFQQLVSLQYIKIHKINTWMLK